MIIRLRYIFITLFLGICFLQSLQKSTFAQQTYSRNIFIGKWIGQGYQCPWGTFHTEKVKITILNQSLTATKIDSGDDDCVPTGSVTFHGIVPSKIVQNSSFPITWVTGNSKQPACCSASGSISIIDENTFIGNTGEKPILFRRYEEN